MRASREVVLAGGAFNTPQLLMLSGVGPREELERHGIPVRVDLPGVGRNLQDRYEVGVVNRMDFDHWKVLAGAKFAAGRSAVPALGAAGGDGVYASNGSVMAVVAKSAPAPRRCPTSLCFALLGHFDGYFPGYSSVFPQRPELPHVGDQQGAHAQPRRPGHAALARPARSARTSTSATSTTGTTRRGEDLDFGRGGHPARAATDGADLRRRGLVAARRCRASADRPTTSSGTS